MSYENEKIAIRWICVTVLLVFIGLFSSCTYVTTENSKYYYKNQEQCILSGGTFIPTKGGNK